MQVATTTKTQPAVASGFVAKCQGAMLTTIYLSPTRIGTGRHIYPTRKAAQTDAAKMNAVGYRFVVEAA